jgi:hypothetical protein
MVFIMKHITYLFLLITLSFLYALLLTTNSPLTLQLQSRVYATSSEQEDNNQDNAQSSYENEDGSDETNSESESSKGAADSDQSESNSNRNDDNDASSTNQNPNCPNITEISNLPLYIGQDGCQYPCPSFDSNDENNIPEGCPTEPSSQTNTELSVKEENPTQTPTQEQQQIDQPQQQQNSLVNPKPQELLSSNNRVTIDNQLSPTSNSGEQASFNASGNTVGNNNDIVSNRQLDPNQDLKDTDLTNKPIKIISKNAHLRVTSLPFERSTNFSYTYDPIESSKIPFSMYIYTHNLYDPSLKYYPASPNCSYRLGETVDYKLKPGTVVLSINPPPGMKADDSDCQIDMKAGGDRGCFVFVS